jgi:hypothetical protein
MTNTAPREFRCYRLSGLVLHSVVPLPELPDASPPSPEPDVVVQWGGNAPFEASRFELAGGGGNVELRFPGLGMFQVKGGSHISICPSAGAAEMDLRALVLGPLWAAVCYQRRRLLLHAAACRGKGRTLLLCGRSGSGKSTLLAALVRMGYVPLSDDTCVVDLTPGVPPAVHGGVPRLKLWPEALARLGLDRRDATPVLSSVDKLQIPWSGVGPPAAGGPGALYLLDWGDPAIEPLRGLTALQELAAAGAYCPWLLEHVLPLAEYWDALLRLLRAMPLFRFRRPQAWDCLPEALDLLSGHVSELS